MKLVFTLLTSLLVMACGSERQSDRPPVTIVQSNSAAPLLSELPPGDAPVVVKRNRDDDFVRPPETAKEEIAEGVRDADGIVILTVEGVQGFLAEQSSWIYSRVNGKVSRILKAPAYRSIALGDDLIVEHEGGQLSIGSRRVTAEPGPLFLAGNTYLLFFVRGGKGNTVPSGAWRIREDRTLAALVNEDKHPNQLGGMTIDQVVDEIRAILKG